MVPYFDIGASMKGKTCCIQVQSSSPHPHARLRVPNRRQAAAAHAAMAAEHAQQGGYGDQQHVPPVSGAAGDMHNGGERLKGAINATIQLLSHGHLIT